jgi:hypothetical protein
MAKDGTELVVGANGKVWIAAEDATAPDDATSALAAGWVDLGYVSEDGVTFSDAIDKKRVMAWNSRRPVRLIAGTGTTTVTFNMLQWNINSVEFALGGSVETNGDEYTFTPDADTDVYRSLCVEWMDGDKSYRLYFSRGITSGEVEVALTGTDETVLPVTFEAMPAETGGVVDPAYLLFTDDANFAAGS